MSIITE